jgi:hypothetical protein
VSPWRGARPRQESLSASWTSTTTPRSISKTSSGSFRRHARRRVPGGIQRSRHPLPTSGASSSSHMTRGAGLGRCRPLRPTRPDRRHGLGRGRAICSPYKFFGPHSALPSAVRSCSRPGVPTRCAPADTPLGRRFETGTLAHELLQVRGRREIHRVDRLGVDQA